MNKNLVKYKTVKYNTFRIAIYGLLVAQQWLPLLSAPMQTCYQIITEKFYESLLIYQTIAYSLPIIDAIRLNFDKNAIDNQLIAVIAVTLPQKYPKWDIENMTCIATNGKHTKRLLWAHKL